MLFSVCLYPAKASLHFYHYRLHAFSPSPQTPLPYAISWSGPDEEAPANRLSGLGLGVRFFKTPGEAFRARKRYLKFNLFKLAGVLRNARGLSKTNAIVVEKLGESYVNSAEKCPPDRSLSKRFARAQFPPPILPLPSPSPFNPSQSTLWRLPCGQWDTRNQTNNCYKK